MFSMLLLHFLRFKCLTVPPTKCASCSFLTGRSGLEELKLKKKRRILYDRLNENESRVYIIYCNGRTHRQHKRWHKIRTAGWLFAIPVTGMNRPSEFQEVEAPRFRDNQHMKVVRLLALRTSLPYPSGNISDIHFSQRLSGHWGHSAELCQWKIPMTPSGIDPATFRQNQDCIYINNGTVSYNVSFKKCSPGRNASEPIKNSAFNRGRNWRSILFLQESPEWTW
jgi:hypothetical protein